MLRALFDHEFVQLLLRPRILLISIILVGASLIPFGLIAKARAQKSAQPRVRFTQHMTSQSKYRAQQANSMFADGRAMRLPVDGTVARGELDDDDHFYRGIVNGTWASTFPMPVTPAVMSRGQERFNIYCTPCHGLAGEGNGIVAQRGDRLAEGTWTPPSSFHTDLVRSRPVGQLFNTVTNGVRNMPAYGSQIPEADRWAIIAYVRALQRSQHASVEDVPAELRATLR